VRRRRRLVVIACRNDEEDGQWCDGAAQHQKR
jgi:hypothetical protein